MKKFLISNVLFYSLATFAGGDEINNGGGIAEKNVMFAYQGLQKIIPHCLNAESCKLDAEEKDLLTRIGSALPEEKKSQGQIRFGSEQSHPGSFLIDGHVKVAMTGNRIGSPISFNLDLLYSKNNLGQYEAASVIDATAILIHEMGHHHGVTDHAALDLLGAKVALFAQKSILTTPLLPHNEKISMVVINEPSVTAFPKILIYAYDKVIDASRAFHKEVDCRTANLPIPINLDIYLPGNKPKGASLHNLYWKDMGESNGYAAFTIRGSITAYCKKDDKLSDGDRDHKMDFTIRLKQDPKTGRWGYLKDSLAVNQTRGDAWWKIIHFPLFGLPPSPDPNANTQGPGGRY